MTENKVTNLKKTEGINSYQYNYWYERFKIEVVIFKRMREEGVYNVVTYAMIDKNSWRREGRISKELFDQCDEKLLLSFLADDAVMNAI